MIHITEHKELTSKSQIEKAKIPAQIILPLVQHLGKPCNPEVKPGDYVRLGQRIAGLDSGVFSPIHTSVSGKVLAIEDRPHPILGKTKAIVIENDYKDQIFDNTKLSEKQIQELTADQIRRIVFEKGIVGLGGASFPTHIKLNAGKKIDDLILNGAECEPYLTSDFRLMLERTKEILLGLKLILKCVEAKNIYIAIEDNKSEAIKKMREAIDDLHLDPAPLVKVLKSFYPQGGERQLIKTILKKEVPSGKIPLDIGILVQNVATSFAIYEAVYENKPLYERVVTVTGSVLTEPKNLLVRIGTPIKNLIEQCGVLKEEPAKVIIGGPMMGIAQYTMDVPVIKSTGGIVLLSKKEVEEVNEEFCIRCTRCIEYCPMGLEPCLISLAVANEDWELAKKYCIWDCIECGLCAYVCPTNRNIVQQVKLAKLKIPK